LHQHSIDVTEEGGKRGGELEEGATAPSTLSRIDPEISTNPMRNKGEVATLRSILIQMDISICAKRTKIIATRTYSGLKI